MRLLRSVDERGNAKLKSKVKPELYTGADTLFAIVEGNPRWFKGLLGELIKKHGSKKRIDGHEQLHQIEIVSKRFVHCCELSQVRRSVDSHYRVEF